MNRILLFITFILGCQCHVALAEWSVFDPIQSAIPPRVEIPEWAQPIDAFIFTRLRAAGLSCAPPVDRRVWIRRVTFDLIGLPPTPAEVQLLINDPRSDIEAMEDVTDRLLASPRYGERWARHWLDVVRYA